MGRRTVALAVSPSVSRLSRWDRIAFAVALAGSVLSGVFAFARVPPVAEFIVSGVALAALAAIVGLATEQVGTRWGPGATGVLQSGLGNLPELFFGIFALRAGLITVVQAALVGSILGNSLLVLGLAFVVGGLRHGTQRFASEPPRNIATLTLLAVAALAVPTLAHELHTPAGQHVDVLSVACAAILIVVFALSIPVSLSGAMPVRPEGAASAEPEVWPLWLAAVVLTAAGAGSAFVSNWFVGALSPAIHVLHLSDAFAGLVIVAVAGNAVENVVGVQMAARNQPDYAISVILNSSLQVALGLIPALVLISLFLGPPHLTLALPPLLLAALGLAAALGGIIVYDGESTWLEGVVLIGLYAIIAAAFWWG